MIPRERNHARHLHLAPGPSHSGVREVARKIQSLQREVERRKKNEERLAAALKEKEILLREIHHRVKNNLQVVTGLLELQSSRLADPVAREICRDCGHRIRTMALLHETLYRHRGNPTHVRMARYVEDLATQLLKGYGRPDRPVEFVVLVDGSLVLPIDTVTPAGLILTELISNSLKHAFPPGRKGRVEVGFTRTAEGPLRLWVGDDGVGLPPAAALANHDSLGMSLVTMLAEQMKGTLLVDRGTGTRFILTFPPPVETRQQTTKL